MLSRAAGLTPLSPTTCRRRHTQTEHAGAVNVLQPPLTDEPYVVAMPAGADALAAQINSTIERLRADGELAHMMGLSTP